MKSTLITIAKFAISLVLLGYLFAQAWQQGQFQALAHSNLRWSWLALALLAGLVATVISFYRWWALVRSLQIPFHLMDAMRLGFISHVFNFLSVGVFGGDAVRAVAAARKVPERMPEAVASVLIDRVIGLLSMFIFASVAYLCTDFSAIETVHPDTLKGVHTVCGFAIAFSIVGVLAMLAMLSFKHLDRWPLCRAICQWPKVGGLFQRILQMVHIFRNNKPQLVAAMLNSMSINALFAISIYCIAQGVSDQHPSLIQHLVIAPIVMVANAAPLPGGLGGMELAMDVMYKAFSQADRPSENGFVVAIGYRLVWLIVAGIGVGYYFFSRDQTITRPARNQGGDPARNQGDEAACSVVP